MWPESGTNGICLRTYDRKAFPCRNPWATPSRAISAWARSSSGFLKLQKAKSPEPKVQYAIDTLTRSLNELNDECQPTMELELG